MTHELKAAIDAMEKAFGQLKAAIDAPRPTPPESQAWLECLSDPQEVPASAWSAFRAATDLTQAQAAALVGVSLGTWRKWEQGANPGSWAALYTAVSRSRLNHVSHTE